MPNLRRSPPPEQAKEAENLEDMELDELRKVLVDQQRMIEQLQQQQQQQQQQRRQTAQAGNPGVTYITEGNLAQFSIRDALEAVPLYDGENIPFVYFVEGCEEACSMITAAQEAMLVRAIRNKLKGDAHRSILGRVFATMREFVEFLRTKYGPRETVYEAQGRLAYLCQKKDEKVAAYANRVRELGKRIIDAQKREVGQAGADFRQTIENNLKTCFLRGLNKEISITREGTFEEIENRAIDAEKELETINMIRRVVLAENPPTEKRTPARRIEATEIICQYCHKRGHTADRCRLVTQHQQQVPGHVRYTVPPRNSFRPNFPPNQANRPIPQRTPPQYQYSNPHLHTGPLQREPNYNPYASPRFKQNSGNQANSIISCRYCKKYGHTIDECRKRAYNNSNANLNTNGTRQPNSNQGNSHTPVRTGATAGKLSSRPTRVINAQESTKSEQ